MVKEQLSELRTELKNVPTFWANLFRVRIETQVLVSFLFLSWKNEKRTENRAFFEKIKL